MVIAGIGMAAASLASSIYGGAKSSKEAGEAERRTEAERAMTEAERRRRLNEDYLNTSAGQNLLRVAREERDDIYRRANGARAVGSGTDASVAIAKEQGNRLVGNAIANIAANDTARKDNINNSYRSQLSQLAQQQIAYHFQRGQAVAKAAEGASNAFAQGAMMAFSSGGTRAAGESNAGSPGGSGVNPAEGDMLKTMGDNPNEINGDSIQRNLDMTRTNLYDEINYA